MIWESGTPWWPFDSSPWSPRALGRSWPLSKLISPAPAPTKGLFTISEPDCPPAAWTTGSCQRSGRRSARRAWPRRWALCPWVGRCWWFRSLCSPLPASPCGLWSRTWGKREGTWEHYFLSSVRGWWKEWAITGGQKPRRVWIDIRTWQFVHKAKVGKLKCLHRSKHGTELAGWGLWQAGQPKTSPQRAASTLFQTAAVWPGAGTARSYFKRNWESDF